MRDALSLLDQAIAHGGGTRRRRRGARDARHDRPGLPPRPARGACAARMLPRCSAIADEMQARSLSFDSALAGPGGPAAAACARAVAAGRARAELPERAQLAALAGRLDPESVQLYYQIALQGRRRPAACAGRARGLHHDAAAHARVSPRAVREKRALARGSKPKTPVASAASAVRATGRSSCSSSPLAGAAPRAGPATRSCRAATNGRFDLVVPKSKAYLAERNYQDKLKAALESHFGTHGGAEGLARRDLGRQRGRDRGRRARRAPRRGASARYSADGFVKDLVNLFDGKVVDSIRPGRSRR